MKSEIHSTEWNSKKGKISRVPISKERRVSLYNFFLSSIAMLPSAQLINACVSSKEKDRAFEWMLNRIHVNMVRSGSRCIIISDEGKSYDSIKRRIGVFNKIPSKFGSWGIEGKSKNIKANSLIEDIVYRNSKRSIFIQAADACAYSLLRKERSLPSKDALGLNESFYILDRILVKAAFAKDPHGIIR